MGGDCEGVGGGGSCRWATGAGPSGVRGIFGRAIKACMCCGSLQRGEKGHTGWEYNTPSVTSMTVCVCVCVCVCVAPTAL